MSKLTTALAAVMLCATTLVGRTQGNLLPLPEDKPIKGMHFPSLSPDNKTLCFSYLGDLWTVAATGGTATRITIHEAHDMLPRWSPDGKWIAFSSNREGNYDIFVIPSGGGTAKQITYQTANDYVMDWSPDGRKLLFFSTRNALTWQLQQIDIASGVARPVTNDDLNIRYGAYSPDGNTVAFNRSGGIGVWWRPRYHGSANFEIYTKNLQTNKLTRITDYDGTDLWPMFSADGKHIYYVTDELTPGNPNLAEIAATGGRPKLLAKQTGDAVRWPSVSPDRSTIAYEYGGDLYTLKTNGGAQPFKLVITAPTDDKENRIIRTTLIGGASELEISPEGKTLALVLRGDIWTIPSDKGGDAKRLTDDPANDYDISWSPDGSKIVFASDRKGNFDIYTLDVKTKDVKLVSEDGNDENNPKFSPDGKSISFLRSGQQGGIYITNADGTGQPRKVAASEGNNIFNSGITDYSWSPDNKWIAFSRRDPTNTVDVWLVPTSGGKETNITYYPGSNVQPAWTTDGKYLLFVSDRDRDDGLDLYALPLQKEKAEDANKDQTDTPRRPRRPRSFENLTDWTTRQPPQGGDQKPADANKPAETKPVVVKIDFDDIENRAKRITTQGVGGYTPVPDGKSVVFSAQGDYWQIPVSGGTATKITTTADNLGMPRFGTDANRFYALGVNGTARSFAKVGPGWMMAQLSFSARLELDRRLEMAQAFNEFWRRMKVGFYDPKMHGVDWNAIRVKYEPLLSGVGTKEEFALYFLSPMVGELNSSHSEIGPAAGTPAPSTAELGLTFDDSYSGPGLKVTGYMPKGPDDDLGLKVKVGEYVMQIDGEDVSWNEAMYKTLYDKTGKTVELLVNSKPSKDGARTEKLKAIGADQLRNLEYDRRIKERRELVEKLSGGRLAYIHIKGMDAPSQKRMERELWGKAREKDGLILDIRDNGGGNTHDGILAEISRNSYGYTQPRDGDRSTQPFRHWDKPIILLINQNSASDAEIFPSGFRSLKLGKILGVATPGYVIGTYSGTLQDGTSYRIPMWGWFYPDGKDMENNGVKPDITVEQQPEDFANNKDRQIEAAVQALLKELPAKK